MILDHDDFSSPDSERAEFESELFSILPPKLHALIYDRMCAAACETFVEAHSEELSWQQHEQPVWLAGCWCRLYQHRFSQKPEQNQSAEDVWQLLIAERIDALVSSSAQPNFDNFRQLYWQEHVAAAINAAVEQFLYKQVAMPVQQDFLDVLVDPVLAEKLFLNSDDNSVGIDHVPRPYLQQTLRNLLSQYGEDVQRLRVSNAFLDEESKLVGALALLTSVNAVEIFNLRDSALPGGIALLLRQRSNGRIARLRTLRILHASLSDEALCKLFDSIALDSDMSDAIGISRPIQTVSQKNQKPARSVEIGDLDDIYGDLGLDEQATSSVISAPPPKRMKRDESSEMDLLLHMGLQLGVKDTLSTFSLMSVPISTVASESLMDLLSQVPNLQHFEMSFNRLDSKGSSNIFTALRNCHQLKTLAVTENDIGHEAVAILAETLPLDMPLLKTIKLSNDEIQPRSLELLFLALRDRGMAIDVLDIAQNHMDKGSARALAEFIFSAGGAKHLNLHQCDLDGSMATLLVDSMCSSSSVLSCCLSDNSIGGTDLACLSSFARLLGCNSSLQHLDISYCSIQLTEEFISSLAQNKTLKWLNLKGNRLDETLLCKLVSRKAEAAAKDHESPSFSLAVSNNRLQDSFAVKFLQQISDVQVSQARRNLLLDGAWLFEALDLTGNAFSSQMRLTLLHQLNGVYPLVKNLILEAPDLDTDRPISYTEPCVTSGPRLRRVVFDEG